MGVMSCHRKNCDSIMCDTYIRDVGYVCHECESEFKEYTTPDNVRTEADILLALTLFMKTPKGTFKNSAEKSIDDFFNEHRR